MDYLKVFLLSAVPVIEIRGGLPLGLVLGLSKPEALLVSVLGNIFIILPWLFVLYRLEGLFAGNKTVHKMYLSLVNKVERQRGKFLKYRKYALFLLVAVPLPTTGAWTACVASRLFRVPLWDSFVIISLGVVTSGMIILTLKTLAISGLLYFW